MSKSKILLQITGSIAAYKACELLSLMVKAGHEVRVVASKNALRFIGEASLEGLSGQAVYSDLWEQGRMMDHIALNRWADLIVVAPATANYLNSMASGTGQDLLGSLFLAHDFTKPLLMAPAMNQAMYQHPVTQKSLLALQEIGVKIINPESGHLACGESGPGRLAEPASIFSEIERLLNPRAKKAGRILITSGGTSESIDDVRVLTNVSTGATGAAVADELIANGYDVTYLCSYNSVKPQGACQQINFVSFKDLQNHLQHQLREPYVAVIHAAAVSDYSPVGQSGKQSSAAETWTLELKKNPKLIHFIREWSVNKRLSLVAFKLTSTPILTEINAAIDKLFSESKADLVIHNDFSAIQDHKKQHHFSAFNQDSNHTKQIFSAETKKELAQKLSHYLMEKHT